MGSRGLTSARQGMKQWRKNGRPPIGWDSPEPMPGTRSKDLAGESRNELEDTLEQVEAAICWVSDLLHDETGMKSFMRYLGTAILGGMITYSAASDATAPWPLGGIALLCLTYGFLSQRKADREIMLEARTHDRDRIIRAIDHLKEQTDSQSYPLKRGEEGERDDAMDRNKPVSPMGRLGSRGLQTERHSIQHPQPGGALDEP